MTLNIEIMEEKKNPLIDRTELTVRIDHFGEGTPNRLEVKKKIAALQGSDEKLTIIKNNGFPENYLPVINNSFLVIRYPLGFHMLSAINSIIFNIFPALSMPLIGSLFSILTIITKTNSP